MFFSFFLKIRIRFAAMIDARGAYGRYIRERQRKIEADDIEPFLLSKFMEYLVVSYLGKCNRIIKRRKSIPNLYVKIQKQYDHLKEVSGQCDARIEKAQAQADENRSTIQKYQMSLDISRNHWNIVNHTGEVTNEMGVTSFKELTKRINETQDVINRLGSKEIELTSAVETEREEKEIKLQPIRSELKKDIRMYAHEIDMLYGVIDSVGVAYEEYLNDYWGLLIKKIEKKAKRVVTERTRKFSEICEINEKSLIIKEALFRENRDIINEQLNELADYEIRV